MNLDLNVGDELNYEMELPAILTVPLLVSKMFAHVRFLKHKSPPLVRNQRT